MPRPRLILSPASVNKTTTLLSQPGRLFPLTRFQTRRQQTRATGSINLFFLSSFLYLVSLYLYKVSFCVCSLAYINTGRGTYIYLFLQWSLRQHHHPHHHLRSDARSLHWMPTRLVRLRICSSLHLAIVLLRWLLRGGRGCSTLRAARPRGRGRVWDVMRYAPLLGRLL